MATTTPRLQQQGQFYQLSREDQVIIVPLRTGHSRSTHHMFRKFHIAESFACHHVTSPMTRTLPAGLSESPEPESRNLSCGHIGEGEDL